MGIFRWATCAILVLGALSLNCLRAADETTKAAAENSARRPTLFLVGDSTVRNGTRGLVGWGERIGTLFDSDRIKVENRAIGGRSSRTFISEGRWDKVL